MLPEQRLPQTGAGKATLAGPSAQPDWQALANNRPTGTVQRQASRSAPIQRWLWGPYYWLKTGDSYTWQTGKPDTDLLEPTGETRYYSDNRLYGRIMGNFQYPVYQAKPIVAAEAVEAVEAAVIPAPETVSSPPALTTSPPEQTAEAPAKAHKKKKKKPKKKDPHAKFREAGRHNLSLLRQSADQTYDGKVPEDLRNLLDQCAQLIDSYQGEKEGETGLAHFFETINAEIDSNYETVGPKAKKDWTVQEFEQATGGRKAKFRSIVEQGLVGPGVWQRQYYTSYEPSGGFATAISLTNAPNTVIHTHYDASDQLRAAHFKPRAQEFQPGHSLNSLTDSQADTFVKGPMDAHYGHAAPWGALIGNRKP